MSTSPQDTTGFVAGIADVRGASKRIAAACVAILVFANGVDTLPRDVSRTLDQFSKGHLQKAYRTWIEGEAKTRIDRVDGLKATETEALEIAESLLEGEDSEAIAIEAKQLIAAVTDSKAEGFRTSLDDAKKNLRETWNRGFVDSLGSGTTELADLAKVVLQGPVNPTPDMRWSEHRDFLLKELLGQIKIDKQARFKRVSLDRKQDNLVLAVRFTKFNLKIDPLSFPMEDAPSYPGLLDFVENHWSLVSKAMVDAGVTSVDQSSIASGLLALAATGVGRGTDSSLRLANVDVAGMEIARAQQLVEALNEDKESLTVYGVSLSGGSILVAVPLILLFLLGSLTLNLRIARDQAWSLAQADFHGDWRELLRPRWRIDGLNILTSLLLPPLALWALWSQLLWGGFGSALGETPFGVGAGMLTVGIGIYSAYSAFKLWNQAKGPTSLTRAKSLLNRDRDKTWLLLPEKARPEVLSALLDAREHLGYLTIVYGEHSMAGAGLDQGLNRLIESADRREQQSESNLPREFLLMLDGEVLMRHSFAPTRWAKSPRSSPYGELIIEEFRGGSPWITWLTRTAFRTSPLSDSPNRENTSSTELPEASS